MFVRFYEKGDFRHGAAALRSVPAIMVFLFLAAGPALAKAPSVPAFGSYFPSWLLCLYSGVIVTVILRAAFVLIGLDDILRWRVLSYMALAFALTLIFSMLFFGR